MDMMSFINQKFEIENLYNEILDVENLSQNYDSILTNEKNEIVISNDNGEYYIIEISCYYKNQYYFNIISNHGDYIEMDREFVLGAFSY